MSESELRTYITESSPSRPAVIWLTVPRVLRTMKGDGEQEETQSNGRRPKAFSATMFLIGHRFEIEVVQYLNF